MVKTPAQTTVAKIRQGLTKVVTGGSNSNGGKHSKGGKK